MKKIIIEFQINDEEDKVATVVKTQGYARDNIRNNFEIVGILENAKALKLEEIKTLMRKNL